MTITASGTTGTPTATKLPLWRRIIFRLGLVLTAIMGFFNTLNGGASLMDPAASPTPPLLSGMLLIVGVVSMLFVALAWIPVRWALIVVIAARSLEFFTMWLPMGKGDWYDSPENRPFYLVLAIVALVVCGLMSFGLHRRAR